MVWMFVSPVFTCCNPNLQGGNGSRGGTFGEWLRCEVESSRMGQPHEIQTQRGSAAPLPSAMWGHRGGCPLWTRKWSSTDNLAVPCPWTPCLRTMSNTLLSFITHPTCSIVLEQPKLLPNSPPSLVPNDWSGQIACYFAVFRLYEVFLLPPCCWTAALP
jgi:hypothetical protein